MIDFSRGVLMEKCGLCRETEEHVPLCPHDTPKGSVQRENFKYGMLAGQLADVFRPGEGEHYVAGYQQAVLLKAEGRS